MSTLRTRIGLALLLFAVSTLVAAGGALWLVLRDLHRDAGSAALADLVVPYVGQARQRLRPGPGGIGRGDLVERLQEARRFLREAQAEIEAAGVTVLLAREDGRVVAITDQGTIEPAATLLDVEIPAAPGQVSRGTADVPGIGPAVFVSTPIFGGRADTGLGALVLLRADDSDRLATADVVRALALAAIVLLLIGVPLAAGLTRSVSRPLDRLASASATVARGELPQPLPTDGPTEVARATAAFNAMASEVAAGREAQRQLLADVRHDLRTPLTVIGGFAEALRDGTAEGPAVRRAADAIADEAARLERMLGDLGDLADLERGGRPLHIEAVEAGEVVVEAAQRFGPQAEARGQHLAVAPVAGGVLVSADRDAVARILANLVVNALSHAPSPGGSIALEVVPVAAGDPPVGGPSGWSGRAGIVLAVRDDGPGIPREALPHVFDRFYRVDPARSGPGSGLGLAIVAGLAHAQSGRAFAESPSSGGARVGVVLPAVVPTG